jgi:hypothetical protein
MHQGYFNANQETTITAITHLRYIPHLMILFSQGLNPNSVLQNVPQ